MKKIMVILCSTLVLLSLCACGQKVSNEIENTNGIEETIIETGLKCLADVPITQGRTFSVNVEKRNVYHVDLNGTNVNIELMKNDLKEDKKSNLTEPEETIIKVIETSRKLVVNYINESNILCDKDELINYIAELSVYVADFSEELTDAAAFYDLETDKIYINREQITNVCEWMIVHEYVHALCQYTNGGKQNLRYSNNLFNEIITDIITRHMNPKMKQGYVSGYAELWVYGYWYFGTFGMDGLKAYFYGYSILFEQIPEAELDVFVGCIEQVQLEVSRVIVSNCINSWRQRGGA